MYFWLGMVRQYHEAAKKRRREAAALAGLPEHLLYDIGMSPDGVPSLARQVRPEGERF